MAMATAVITITGRSPRAVSDLKTASTMAGTTGTAATASVRHTTTITAAPIVATTEALETGITTNRHIAKPTNRAIDRGTTAAGAAKQSQPDRSGVGRQNRRDADPGCVSFVFLHSAQLAEASCGNRSGSPR